MKITDTESSGVPRRNFLLMAGAAALTGHSLLAEDHSAHMNKAAGRTDSGRYGKSIAAAGDCIAKAEICLSHCLNLLAKGDTAMSECALTARNSAALCQSFVSLASASSRHTSALMATCIAACEDCIRECEKHAKHHAECKACLEACKACIREMKKVA